MKLQSMPKTVALCLACTAILGTAQSVCAAQIQNVKDFTDYAQDLGYGKIQGSWAETIIDVTVLNGGISGYPEGDFRLNKEISAAELLSILFGVTDTEITSQARSWSTRMMQTGYDNGILTPEMIRLQDATKPVTREQMAYMLVKSAENLCKENTNTAYDVSIPDLATADPQYQDAIQRAYNIGLLAGTESGFAPKAYCTRAETCAIVNRLMHYSDRIENIKPEDLPKEPEETKYEVLLDGSNVGQSSGIFYPTEGQYYQGKEITRDEKTGVLGYGNGQTGGIYLHIRYGDREILNGSALPAGDSYDNAVGYYTTHGAYTYWTKEWDMIALQVTQDLAEKYPDAPAGSMADLYGNRLYDVSPTDESVFFVKAEDGTWVFRY